MSTSPSFPDHLSFSPSLSEILSLLDHADVVSCKLVNRRINDVIAKNSTRMPRENAELVINMIRPQRDFPYDRHYVQLQLTCRRKSKIVVHLLLHEERICLYKCPVKVNEEAPIELHPIKLFCDYLTENVPPYFGPDADDRLKEVQRFYIGPDDAYELLEYKSDGVAHSLELIFEYIFRKYNMRNLYIWNKRVSRTVIEPYITLLCQMFQKHGRWCRNLKTEHLYSQCIHELNTRLAASRQTNHVDNFDMLVNYLDGIKGWGGKHTVQINPQTLRSLQPLVQLIEGWSLYQTVKMPKSLKLSVLENPEAPNIYRYSMDLFMSKFVHINGFSIGERNGEAEISRDDGKRLTIKYTTTQISVKCREHRLVRPQ